MTTQVNVLKIQVPASRPVPPYAFRIGEVFANFLAASNKVMGIAFEAAQPSVIRAGLHETAALVEAQRPSAALSLRSAAARGWVC